MSQKSRLVRGGFKVYIPTVQDHSFTVKLVVLAAVPCGVVMSMVPVTAHVGTVAVTSVLDFTLNSAAAVWRVPVTGGEASKVIEDLRSYIDLAIVDGGAYFIPKRRAGSGSSIQFLSFSTNHISTVATFEKPLGMGLAVSPDGKWILYSQVEESGSELMLVENFH